MTPTVAVSGVQQAALYDSRRHCSFHVPRESFHPQAWRHNTSDALELHPGDCGSGAWEDSEYICFITQNRFPSVILAVYMGCQHR